MMKNVKNIEVWYPFMPRLPFHYDVKMVSIHFLTFKRTKSSGQVNFLMLEWHKLPYHLG